MIEHAWFEIDQQRARDVEHFALDFERAIGAVLFRGRPRRDVTRLGGSAHGVEIGVSGV